MSPPKGRHGSSDPALCAPGLEAQFTAEAARDRGPILVAIFFFDLISYAVRLAARAAKHGVGSLPQYILTAIAPQLLNMVLLYTAVYFINQRSRRQYGNPWAAIQASSHACLCMWM